MTHRSSRPYLWFLAALWYVWLVAFIATPAQAQETAGPDAFQRVVRDFAIPPRTIIEGVTFTEQVDVRDPWVGYKDCTFAPRNDTPGRFDNLYGVKVWPTGRFAQFLDCTFTGGTKGLVGEWMSVRWCTFEDIIQDGVFVLGGNNEIFANTFRRLGYDPLGTGPGLDRKGRGIHADGVQIALAANHRVVGNFFDLPHGEGKYVVNGCIYVENDIGNFGVQVERVVVNNNWADGGLYPIRFVADKRSGIPPRRVIVRGNKVLRYYFGPFTAPLSMSALLQSFYDDNDTSEATKYRP